MTFRLLRIAAVAAWAACALASPAAEEETAPRLPVVWEAPDALRARIKSGPASKPVERADQAAVEQLLAEEEIQESPDASTDFQGFA